MSVSEPVDPRCPSCGRQFGERIRCVYCAATREGRKEVSRIQLYALPLLVASIYFFYQAMYVAPTYRAITSLGEKDNFRRVRVRGEVLSVRVFTDKYERGTSVVLGLSALGEKASGSAPKNAEIRLKADGRIGHELKPGGRVPSVGDILDVSASLFAGRGYRLLSLNSARNLKVVGATENKVVYTATTVAEVLADPEALRDKAIELTRVRIAKRLGRFHLGVVGADDSQVLRVYGLKQRFYRPDDVVSLRGRWTQFKEGMPWELKVDAQDPSACVVLEKSEKPAFKDDRPKSVPPKVVTIAEVLADLEGHRNQPVKVDRAEVVAVRGRRSMDVRDEAGADALAVYGVDPWKFEPGDIVSVSGKLAKYEKANRWEIKIPRKGRGVRMLQKRISDRKPATIAQLLAAPADYEDMHILVPEAVVTTIEDARSFLAGGPAGSISVPVSEKSTASGAASESSTPSVLVAGSSTEKLSEGAVVKIRGQFVRRGDGDVWEIKTAERDDAAVRVSTSRRPSGGEGR